MAGHTEIKVNTRVRLLTPVSDEQIPAGTLGTVLKWFPADDDLIFVAPDCAPHKHLLYYASEIGRDLAEIDAEGGTDGNAS